IARTASPPYPGLSASGNYLIATSAPGFRTVSIDFGALAGAIFLMAFATGSPIAAPLFGSLAVLPLALGSISIVVVNQGPTTAVAQNIQVNVSPTANTIPYTVLPFNFTSQLGDAPQIRETS